MAQALPPPASPQVTGALERFECARRPPADRRRRAHLRHRRPGPGGAAHRRLQRLPRPGDLGVSPGASSALALPHITQPEAAKHLKTLDALYSELAAALKRAVGAAPTLPAAQNAARAIAADARDIAAAAPAAEAAPASSPLLAWLPLVLLAAGLALLIAALVASLRMSRTVERQRASAETQRKESDRNQQAILRLLDELSSLADGDLTVQATVTEDITGAIADSINYAVDALRGLVTTINGSAIQLDSATRQTQALSQHLAKASRRAVEADRLGHRVRRQHGRLGRGGVRQRRARRRRGAPLGRGRAQGRRCGAAHHRRHERHPRDHPGDLQAHQAPRRELAGDRQHRRAHQRHRRADQHPGAQRLDPVLHGRGCRARLRGGGRRGAAPGRARRHRHQADRGAGAHHPDRHQRGGRVHGAQHHRRGRRGTAGRECRRGAGRDRAGLQPDREPGAEYFRQRPPADAGGADHRPQHAGSQGDQRPDGRVDPGDLDRHRQARRAVGRPAQVRFRLPPAGQRQRRPLRLGPAAGGASRMPPSTRPRCGRSPRWVAPRIPSRKLLHA